MPWLCSAAATRASHSDLLTASSSTLYTKMPSRSFTPAAYCGHSLHSANARCQSLCTTSSTPSSLRTSDLVNTQQIERDASVRPWPATARGMAESATPTLSTPQISPLVRARAHVVARTNKLGERPSHIRASCCTYARDAPQPQAALCLAKEIGHRAESRYDTNRRLGQ